MNSVSKNRYKKHSLQKRELPALLKHQILFQKEMLELDRLQIQKDNEYWNKKED